MDTLANMARSTKQIQQELDSIKEAVTELAEELQTLYERYLANLSESGQKQLILASYQLCTQIYPETFLAISLGQRQNLQQALRKLGQEIKPLLTKQPTAEDLSQEQANLNLIAEMLQKLPLESSQKSDRETLPTPRNNREPSATDNNTDENEESSATIMIEENEDFNEKLIVEEIREFSLEKLQNLADGQLEPPKIQEIDLSNPHHVILWHQRIESKIRKTLEDISRQANKYLQEFEIIPTRLPSKVIEIALKAGDSNSGNGKLRKVPNIISLVIETEKRQKNKKTTATQISLLRLHLSEIEFADARLSGQKNEIRMLLKKIKKLRNLYQEKEQEYAIAQADAAWRSSWYEE